MTDAPLPEFVWFVDEVARICGKRYWVGGVVGTCAICAMPFPYISRLSTVVGFVLAAMLLKVRGSERYDDEESDGEGEGGELGGIGRRDASSSASSTLPGGQLDSGSKE